MSNLFEGTKGEWEKVDNSFINDVRCGNSTIATVFNNGGLAVGEANAHLISAAPNLLDAAVDAWVLLNYIPEGYMEDYFKKVKTKLSVAISKALNREGETSND